MSYTISSLRYNLRNILFIMARIYRQNLSIKTISLTRIRNTPEKNAIGEYLSIFYLFHSDGGGGPYFFR